VSSKNSDPLKLFHLRKGSGSIGQDKECMLFLINNGKECNRLTPWQSTTSCKERWQSYKPFLFKSQTIIILSVYCVIFASLVLNVGIVIRNYYVSG